MKSLSSNNLELDSNGLGEIREIKLYSEENLVGLLRKASNTTSGNNEFFEYICRYVDLRQKYSQDLLLNSIVSDLSNYSIEELEIFEKYAVPVSNNESAINHTKYFGTISINERSITPLLVPAGVDLIKVVDSSGEEKLNIDLSECGEFDKVVLIVIDQKKPDKLLVVNLPAKSWSTSKEQERWLKYKYTRNDERYKTISSIKQKGPLVFDVLSGNILGTEFLNAFPLLEKRLEQEKWNPFDTYKRNDSEFWKGEEWISLAPKNKSKLNPKLSPLWDDDPIKILNKRVRIVYDPSEIESISPDRYITLNSEKNVRFTVKVADGLTLEPEGITPSIVGSLEKEVGVGRYFFTVFVTENTEAVKISATKSYIAKINKINKITEQGAVVEVLERPIEGTPQFDENDNCIGFKFDLTSYSGRNQIASLKRDGENISLVESSPGIYIDNIENIELGHVYTYTLEISTQFYIVHVIKGDKFFEIDNVYQVVTGNESVTIRFYDVEEPPSVEESWPTIIINNDTIDTIGSEVTYNDFRIENRTFNGGIYTLELTGITNNLEIKIG